MQKRTALALLFALATVACTATPVAPTGPASPTTGPTTSATGAQPTPPQGSPTASVGTEPTDDLDDFMCSLPFAGEGHAANLNYTDLRVARHDGYDRIVFEFAQEGMIPHIELRAEGPPFTEDASGNPVDVPGTAFLVLTLRGVTARGPDGQSTYDGPVVLTPELPAVTSVVRLGDFEDVLTWAIGLTGETCYRIFPVGSPSRFVIDLQHPAG